MYLENKLNSTFSLDDDPVEENDVLPKVQELINSGNGDPSRLQHIYDTLSNNKPPYHSDQAYLESKLDTLIQEEIPVKSAEIKKITKKVTLEINLEESQQEPQKTETITDKEKGVMPKGWSSEDSPSEISEIDKTRI
ncbi:MAG: hypothetical protein LVO36_04405 [Nitrosopumilus sp. (ex Thoosa mismalolli)]|nr:hypothetical protein [Nitrosopumilus sp. (ex Thoosa mismalolli)]